MPRSAPSRRDLVRFGTSSFSSRDWVGNFYPAGTAPAEFLRLYAERYDTVEVDSTYYAIPSPRTVAGWVAHTPEQFLMAAKFPRSIVHGGDGARPAGDRILIPEFTYRDRDRFLAVMGRLGSRCGPLLLQFPYLARSVFPGREPFLERLERFAALLPRDFRYAVEIRNRAWVGPELALLCRRHRLALVLVDQAWMPHADEIEQQIDPVTSDFVYVRLLGDRKEVEALTRSWDREVIDRSERLERWASFLARLAARGVPALVYVNNHYAGHAPSTLERLRHRYAAATGRRPAGRR